MSNHFIVLNGNSSVIDKKTTVANLDKSQGKQEWLTVFDKNPNIIVAPDQAVIFNNVNALLRFNFSVVGGVYDITVRCICPSANSDSGFYSLDGDVFRDNIMRWSLDLGPTKYVINQYIYKLLTKQQLNAGPHYLNFLYREPLAMIDVKIKNVSTSEEIVIKAIDVLNEKLSVKPSSFVEVATVNADPAVIKQYAPSSVQIDATVPEVATVFSTSVSTNVSYQAGATTTPIVSAKSESGATVPLVVGVAPVPVVVVEPVVQPVPPPPIILPVIQPMVSPPSYVVTASPGPGVVAQPPTPLFECTGSYQNSETSNYYLIVFTGNGTIKFNRSMPVNVITVGGGGGGAGGSFQITNKFYSYGRYTGGNGGDGGANILGVLTTNTTKLLNVVVGQGGISGSIGQSGTNGGDTLLGDGTTNYITCKGGNGGRYNNIDSSEYTASDNEFALGPDYYKEKRMNPSSSSLYTINSTVISAVQSGGIAPNQASQGGLGGLGGYFVEENGKKDMGTGGGSSSTFNIPFKNIPSELSLIRTNYGGAGGGGDYRGAGKNGEGKGGVAGFNTNNIGGSGPFYGTGGGGGYGNNPGGNGYQGLLIFFFSKASATATTNVSSYMSVITVTEKQTSRSPIYMTTTISPLPFSGMTVWLSAKTMAAATTNSNWKNNAPNATSDASNMGKLLSNAYNATIFNGQPGLNLAAGNAVFAVQMPARNSPTGLTVLVVLRPVSNNSTYVGLVSRGTTKFPAPFDMYNNQRAIGDGSTTNFKFTTSSVDLKKLALNTNYLLVFRIAVNADKTSTISEWLNGRPSTISPNNLTSYGDTSTYFYIGGRADNATLFSGYIGEVVYYNRPLLDAEVSNATTYLNSKYKIF